MAAIGGQDRNGAVNPDDPAFADLYGEMIEHDRARALAELGALVQEQPQSVAAWAMLSVAHQRCLDFPACAARTLSFLCSASGTPRIWMVFAMQSACLHALCLSIRRGPWPTALLDI